MKRNNERNSEFVQVVHTMAVTQGKTRAEISLFCVAKFGIETKDHGFRAWFSRLKNLKNPHGGQVWPEMAKACAAWKQNKTKPKPLDLPVIDEDPAVMADMTKVSG